MPRTAAKWNGWTALLALLSLAVGSTASASSREFKWEELQKAGRVTYGSVQPPDASSPFHHLKVDSSGTGAAVTVLTIERPSVTGPRYALTGQVRCAGVEGIGYLELWSHFPDGSRFFSRTLADAGPMMKLQGTTGWRAFTLPFDATGAPPPTRLVLNVVFPGAGSVSLGPVQLVDLGQGAVAGALDGSSWTSDRIGGLFGAIAGGLVGCLGALIGTLTSLGRARRFVIGTATGLVILGSVTFLAGLAALAQAKPYAVSYPLLLVGFLSAIIPLGLLPSIRRRYEDIELRAMRARDL